MSKPIVVVICGPTASGKTALSIEVAKKINGEIISADSMQIYKDMNIGTAKPTAQEMQGIKHYLIDCVSPSVRFSVADFKKQATLAIEEILKRGKTPIVVGGTGLYVDSLTLGIDYSETKVDLNYRLNLEKLAQDKGLEHVYNLAKEIDSEAIKKISVNDKKRIFRILEIYNATGKTKTELEIDSRKSEPMYDFRIFAIDMDRAVLYDRINQRADKMIKNGLIDEVKELINKYDELPTAMQGLGYKEVACYLNGECSKTDMIEKIKMESRRYAKRQLTWFRRNKDIKWLQASDGNEKNANIILEEIRWFTIEKNNLKNKKIIKVTTIIATTIIMVYLIVLLIKVLSKPTQTFVVERGKIYQEEFAEGYIIRDETIINLEDSQDEITPIKNEGEKIAKGEQIYRYFAENESEISAQIEELDIEIQNNLSNDDNNYSSDVKLINKQIDSELDSIYDKNSIHKINQERSEINALLTKKMKVKAESSSNETLKKLLEKRNSYENKLIKNSKYIEAEKSGVISYRVDGLEDILKSNDFTYLNEKFLKNLKIETGQIVASTTNKGKIVDNFGCNVACILTSEEAKNSELGKSIKLRLQTGEEIPAKIVYKSKESESKYLLVFEINDSVTDLIKYRKSFFDVIWWSDSGLKIPNSAIKYEGDFAYVIRNRAGLKEKILVKVLRKNDKYSVVDNYSYTELEEAGYNMTEMKSKKSISVYDQIEI